MLPLLTALLLAVWMFQPWAALAESSLNGMATEPPSITMTAYPPSAAEAMLARQEKLAQRASTPTLAPAPEPAPPPAPAPAPGVPLTKQQIEALVCTYGWPCEQALGVMWCESGGKPWAIGRGANYGLFQINQIHARRIPDFWTAWMDPAKNIEWANALWSRQGWKPWACRP